MLVFDLDGTLVDTRRAVIEAYAHVGVTMPGWAWGMPWYKWLGSKQLHDAKSAVYPEMLKRYALKLRLYDVASRLYAPVITGASDSAVRAVTGLFGPLNVRMVEATTLRKVLFLARCKRTGTYIDDDEKVREQVEVNTRWTTASPQSFWQRELTHASGR